MALLEISCLGLPEVRHGGASISLPTRKTLALLMYLAIEPGMHSREALAALFWPEADEERARGALRRVVADLRRSLGRGEGTAEDHIQATRNAIGLERADLRIDLVSPGPAGNEDETQLAGARDPRVAALERYRGELLAGLSLPGADAFEDWLFDRRMRAQRAITDTCQSLAADRARSGRAAEARSVAARWIEIDRLDERAHRALIEALIMLGDRSGAMQAFDSCRALLLRELDVEPEAATVALGMRARSLPAPPSPERPRPGELPFAGRAMEYGQLVEAFQTTREHAPQVVHLAGASGMGKTRLAREFAEWTRSQGGRVWAGRALDVSSGLPYQALADLLRSGIDVQHVRALGAPWAGKLATILPELNSEFGDGRFDTDPGRLSEACCRLLAEEARRGPVVLVIDDLQWSDQASLDVLGYVLAWIERTRTPVLTVTAYRVDEVREHGPTSRWIESTAGGAMGARTIRLDALRQPDARALLQAISSDHEPVHAEMLDRVAERLLGRTGGQPLFVAELLRSILGSSKATTPWQLSLESLELGLADYQGIPTRVQQLIRRRVGRLSPPAVAVIEAAGVLGSAGRFAQAVAVSGLDADAGTAAGDECVDAVLLTIERGQYAFTHDSAREIVYDFTGGARRAALHARAYAQLKVDGAPAAVLAVHALGAGMDREAFRQLRAAGDRALASGAGSDAVAHYRQALELERGGPEERAEVALGLGRALEVAGDQAGARTIYEEAIVSSWAPAVAARAAVSLATIVSQSDFDFAHAERLLHRALTDARRSGSAALRAETEWAVGQSAAYQMRFEESIRHGRRSLRIARQQSLAHLESRAWNLLVYGFGGAGRWSDAARAAGQAHAGFESVGDRIMEVDSGAMECWALGNAGRIDAAVAAGVAARRAARASGNAWGIANVATHLAFALAQRGELGEALEVADEGRRVADAGLPLMMRVPTLVTYGCLQRALFDIEGATDTHRHARKLAESVRWTPFLAMTLREEAVDELLQGAFGRAGDLATRAFGVQRQWVFQPTHDAWLYTLALRCAGRGAEADFVRVLGANGSNRRYVFAAAVARAAVGLAADGQGAAPDSFETAESMARRLGLRLDRMALAALRMRTGDGDGQLREVAEELAVSLNGPARARFLAAATTHPLLDLDLDAHGVRPSPG
ncbi:MAG: AAA family ATPase [Dehalococcoidia bacterium]|nr:AAA family ATPase [Dehalococcoidia bacterium]